MIICCFRLYNKKNLIAFSKYLCIAHCEQARSVIFIRAHSFFLLENSFVVATLKSALCII